MLPLVGQGLRLLPQDADEHDQSLQPGGVALQVVALSVAGPAALKEAQGPEGVSQLRVVRCGGGGQGPVALPLEDSGGGGNREGGHRVLRHQIAVTGREKGLGGDLCSLGQIDQGPGGELCGDAAGEGHNHRSGGAGQQIPLL